jgi:LmbE family N-acetylglucosaminyl deacetylase
MTAGELLDAAHSLPFRPLREQLEDRPFVVVAPHPDDESLACGGLIADATRQGLQGKVVIVSDGVGSHPNSRTYPPDRLRSLREGEARQAAAELGLRLEQILFLGLPDRFVPCEGEEAERAIDVIVHCVRKIGARSLFVSWRHDPHCDHRASCQIARGVQRREGELRLFEYVVWGPTLPPATEVDTLGGFRIRLDTRLSKKSVARLPRTARRRAISLTTTRLDFDSPRANWAASIFLMSSFLRATHERAARNAKARVF